MSETEEKEETGRVRIIHTDFAAMPAEPKKPDGRIKVPPTDKVSLAIGLLLDTANGGRKTDSLRLHLKHANKALSMVMEGAPVAWVFGANSTTSRAGFFLVVRDKDNLRVIVADVRRADANNGPLGAFPKLAPWGESAAFEKDVEGMTPEKIAKARAAGRGIETHALAQVTDPGLRERLKALFHKPPTGAAVNSFTLDDVAAHFGIEL
jgi:hypothetical protein